MISLRCFVSCLALAAVLGGCDMLPSGLGGGAFTVHVEEPGGRAVVGAHIRGGIDWDAFDVATDSAGEARLPSRARHVGAMIRAENHLAVPVAGLEPVSYRMQATPGRVHLLGLLWGNLVAASAGEVTTVSIDGYLNRFAYSEAGVTRTFSTRLEPATAINAARLERDTLWLANGDGHLEAWSYAPPEVPRLLFALPILTFDWATLDSVRVGGLTTTSLFTYTPSGELRTLGTVSLPTLRRAWRLDGTHALLVALSYVGDPVTVAVVDATNPRQPHVAFRRDFPGVGSVTLMGDTLLLAHPGTPGQPVVHERLDLSDAEHPRDLTASTAPAEISGMLSDTIAVGTLRVGASDDGELAFLRRRGSDFETLATTGGLFWADSRQVALLHPFALATGYAGGVWELDW